MAHISFIFFSAVISNSTSWKNISLFLRVEKRKLAALEISTILDAINAKTSRYLVIKCERYAQNFSKVSGKIRLKSCIAFNEIPWRELFVISINEKYIAVSTHSYTDDQFATMHSSEGTLHDKYKYTRKSFNSIST